MGSSLPICGLCPLLGALPRAGLGSWGSQPPQLGTFIAVSVQPPPGWHPAFWELLSPSPSLRPSGSPTENSLTPGFSSASRAPLKEEISHKAPCFQRQTQRRHKYKHIRGTSPAIHMLGAFLHGSSFPNVLLLNLLGWQLPTQREAPCFPLCSLETEGGALGLQSWAHHGQGSLSPEPRLFPTRVGRSESGPSWCYSREGGVLDSESRPSSQKLLVTH